MSILARLLGRPVGGAPLPELTSGGEEGWADCIFAAAPGAAPAAPALRARALHDGEVVGFDVALPSAWERVDYGPALPVVGFRGAIVLRSVGEASDRFVRALADLYGIADGPPRMAEAVPCVGITLEGDRDELDAGRMRIKLFFTSDDDERYAEAYLNVDRRAGRVELAEKDEDYRGSLLRALAAP